MSASTFRKKFYPFSLGLSLLSAIAFSLPQSVQAISFAPTQPQWVNTSEELTVQQLELLRRRQEEEWRKRQQNEELLQPVSRFSLA
jgi:hypothetical protein